MPQSSVQKKITLPKQAKIVRGHWKDDNGYGDVWCKIRKIDNVNSKYPTMGLDHPKYGEFAWVLVEDCKLR